MHFGFKKHSKYTRYEIYKTVTDKDDRPPFDFAQTGYGRVGDDLFIFMNVGIPGRTGEDYFNHYDEKTESISWCAKRDTHSGQPLMKKIINGEINLYFFARWEREGSHFIYLGIGHVISYQDGRMVADKDGNDAICMEYLLTCQPITEDIPIQEVKIGKLTLKGDKPKPKKINPIKRKFRAIKGKNYILTEIKNTKTGEIGEQLVLDWERNRLTSYGLSNYANAIIHTSKVEGDGTGYDIKSFNEDGSIRYIEVKTTTLGINSEFYMTPNEMEFSDKYEDSFYIYRVYDLVLEPVTASLHIISGNILNCYDAEPTEFKLTPK